MSCLVMIRCAVLAALAASAGCSSFIDKQAASSTLKILDRSMQAAARQPDVELAREAMPGGIVQLEAFALAYPNQPRFRELHADAVCQYAVAFVFDDWEEASLTGRTDDASRIAERLQGLLGACVDANKALPPSLRTELWFGMTGAVQLAVSPLAHLHELTAIKAHLAKVATTSPGFHDADAEVLLGTLESTTHAMLGGPDGTARFAAARKLTAGRVLSVDVMFARAVAVARKDRTLFTSTLERVIAADVRQWPEHRLANELAKRKARRYLAAVDTLIPR